MKIPLLTVILTTLLLNGCSDGTAPDSSIAATMAQRIASGEDHITAAELAERLIRDLRDFELIDIRDAEDFSSGHIRGARHIPLERLLAADSLASLPAGRSIVVYSNGSAHAAQAALLLQLTGRDTLALLGGYNYWQAYLHDPEKAGVAEMDPAERKRYQAVSCYLAGDYVAAAGLLPDGAEQGEAAGAEEPADALGLGLGLGNEQIQQMDLQDNATPAMETDPLGLGLGLGTDETEPDSTPAAPPKNETRKLLIRAEC
jgi:rhodanese-related sulfurtransferase